MTDDISPAAGKARRTAYADAMRKLNGASVPRPIEPPSTGPQKWTLPPLTEVDEYGFLVNGDGSAMFTDTNTPDDQSRISWRARGR